MPPACADLKDHHLEMNHGQVGEDLAFAVVHAASPIDFLLHTVTQRHRRMEPHHPKHAASSGVLLGEERNLQNLHGLLNTFV